MKYNKVYKQFHLAYRLVVIRLALTSFLFISGFLYTQINVNIDSLRKDIDKSIHDTSKVKTLYRLCIVLRTDSPIAALRYGKKALELSEVIQFEKGKASALNNLGAVYDHIGEKEKAINYFVQAFQLKRKINDVKGLANTLNNIGVIYKRDGDYKNALHYFRLTEHYLNLYPNKVLKYNLKYNIANTYKSLNKNDSAIYIYDMVLNDVRENKDTNLLVDIAIQRSEALLNTMRNDEAIKNLLYLKRQFTDYIYKHEKHGVFTQLAECYLRFNKIDSAFNVLNSYRFSEKDTLDIDLMLTINKIKSDLFYQRFLKTNNIDFLKAAYYHKNLIPKLMNDLGDYQNSKALSNMIMKSEIEKMEEDIISFRHSSEIAAIKSRQQYAILLISILALLIISVLSVLTYKKYRIQSVLSDELKKKNEIIELKNSDILSSIQYAKRIQYTLLAHEEYLNENLPEHFIYFHPKDIVSGDFYWATNYNNKFYIAVCDSTGHGVPGAFMSLLNIGFLSEAINEKGIERPNEVFDYVRMKLTNSISKEGQKDGFDGILVCFDPSKNSVSYAAANNAPILIRQGQLLEQEADRMPVGVGERKENFKLHTIEADRGDVLYLYTDGYADQFGGPKGKKLKYKVLNEMILANYNLPLETQKGLLKESFEKWKGDLEQVDDVCVIGIRI